MKLVSRIDPILRKVAEEVPHGESISSLGEEMVRFMIKQNGVGLAAPQIGISKRLFVMRPGAFPWIVVNPQMSNASGSRVMAESCLSLPGVTRLIDRPEKIEITFFDEKWKLHSMTASQMFSRVFQHELDHLNGILIA